MTTLMTLDPGPNTGLLLSPFFMQKFELAYMHITQRFELPFRYLKKVKNYGEGEVSRFYNTPQKWQNEVHCFSAGSNEYLRLLDFSIFKSLLVPYSETYTSRLRSRVIAIFTFLVRIVQISKKTEKGHFFVKVWWPYVSLPTMFISLHHV